MKNHPFVVGSRVLLAGQADRLGRLVDLPVDQAGHLEGAEDRPRKVLSEPEKAQRQRKREHSERKREHGKVKSKQRKNLLRAK
jgi:hypothetical protein